MLLLTTSMIWVVGLLTAVPYAIYHLLFYAERDKYALLLTFVFFWIFGYWGVVGPLLAAIKIRRVFRAMEQAGTKTGLLSALQSKETEEAAIELISSENHIPRFLAAYIFRLLVTRLPSRSSDPQSVPDHPPRDD